MTIAESLLPEFDQEMAVTRRFLERVPEDKFAWQPHEKSATLEWLAKHVARLAGWVSVVLATESVDVMGADEQRDTIMKLGTRAELLAYFDKAVAAARTALAQAGDAAMRESWSLKAGPHEIFTLPRVAVIRTMTFSHLIHHRAQLGVYFRLLDIPVPGAYGPTADEPLR